MLFCNSDIRMTKWVELVKKGGILPAQAAISIHFGSKVGAATALFFRCTHAHSRCGHAKGETTAEFST
jgi:hypothetical protein